MAEPVNDDNRPLCVDLDGTLIAGDTLAECVSLFMRQHPLMIWRLPVWLAAGVAPFKQQLATHAAPDVSVFVYRPQVMAFVKAQHAAGRRLVLTTASDHQMAQRVAEHLGLFDDIVASNGKRNFKGTAKLTALEQRFGRAGFDYIGDGRADLPVWTSARDAYVVDAEHGAMRRAAERVCQPREVFDVSERRLPLVLKTLRPHQWAKNLLVFLPLLLAHRVGEGALVSWLIACAAFVAFCAAASAVYVLNDFLDLEADRRHPLKRERPFASGRLPIRKVLPLTVIPLCIALVGAALTASLAFLGLLAVYLLTTSAYSLYFKRVALLDVFILAGLYTLRILAGGAAVGVAISPWLLALSMFLFLSLAFMKRYTELRDAGQAAARDDEQRLTGRGYGIADMDTIQTLGPTAGYLAVLVFCLYISSDKAQQLYHSPWLLWLVAPIMLYWVTYVWFTARRGGMHHDPVAFALGDRVSLVCVLIVGVLALLAKVL